MLLLTWCLAPILKSFWGCCVFNQLTPLADSPIPALLVQPLSSQEAPSDEAVAPHRGCLLAVGGGSLFIYLYIFLKKFPDCLTHLWKQV